MTELTAYAIAIDVDSLTQLRINFEPYRHAYPSAAAVVDAMTENDFPVWYGGLRMERNKRFAGQAWAEKYGSLLLPEEVIL